MSYSAKVVTRLHEVQIAHHAEEPVADFPRIEKIVRALSMTPPGRLLDVGYSAGGFADALVEMGWDCTGLDINQRRHSRVKTIQCDLNEGFPVEADGYDLVTAGEIIEHMIDESAFLAECRRVLRPHGRLVLTTPNLSYLVNRFLVFAGRTPMFVYAPYHYHFHTYRTLVHLVETNGFEVERVSASHVLYSRRFHWTGRFFELLADWFPSFGAHLIVYAKRRPAEAR
ncbi:MAG TPA: class I SAM-dependent methyltransferase [Nitrospira sp.]|nr:class I SAM-dependent methyltransferase [Nitrospira sp.]